MSRIQKLSPNLINKIAAGEVIERPASVVKELVENSIDAGATRIDVTIEKGGSDLIRIADNGCGMDMDDLILAVTSHATSKLRSEEDLFSVATMGFRGEAMASVAEISQMTIRSRVNPGVKPTIGEATLAQSAESVSGAQLTVQGGAYEPPTPCGTSPGTIIDVRNLFFNTPVRRKFLKSVSTEFGHITETFQRLALANPQIHFTLTHNGRTIYDVPATTDWLQRIADVEGKELALSLLYVEKHFGEIFIHGYVARPNQNRSNPKMQHLFLNGRPIKDRSLQHALNEAYRGLLMTNRYPICFLEIQMPLSFVDVNVHPTKFEVRFQDSGLIYSQLLSTLREKFLRTNLSTYVHDKTEETDAANDGAFQPANQTFRNMDAPDAEDTEPNRQSQLAWSERPSSNRSDSSIPPFRPFDDDFTPRSGGLKFEQITESGPVGSWGSVRRGNRAGGYSPSANYQSANANGTNSDAQGETNEGAFNPNGTGTEALPASIAPKAIQIHKRYIVTECEEGLMVIDQHAMHERILYERLKFRMQSKSVEVQRLLIPEPVDLRPTEAALVLQHRQTLEDMGILIEPFGGSTVLVHGMPAILGTFRKEMPLADELIREVITYLQTGSGTVEIDHFTDNILHTLACKAAVKAGQALSQGEIDQLLAEYQNCTQADHCPHGRPSVLIWSCQELDKLYGRLGQV